MKVLKVDFKDLPKDRNDGHVLKYCRKLIKNGVSPKTRLEAYRGDVLCITIKNIGEAAKWTFSEEPRLHLVPFVGMSDKDKERLRLKRASVASRSDI